MRHYRVMSNRGHSTDWPWERVKAELWARGLSLSALAREHDLHRQYVAGVASRPWPRMEAIIADALDLRPQDIWPSRYTADGLPVQPNAWIAAHERRLGETTS